MGWDRIERDAVGRGRVVCRGGEAHIGMGHHGTEMGNDGMRRMRQDGY